MISERYRSTEPVRHERMNTLTNELDIWFTCPKCLSHLIDMKCIHCNKHLKIPLTPEEEVAMSEKMNALVLEYNTLTGKGVKRFASLAIGQQKLDQARHLIENPKPKVEGNGKPKGKVNEKMSASVRTSWDDEGTAKRRGQRNSCAVEGHGAFRTVGEAFVKLSLPMGRCIPFRGKLKTQKHLAFDHNGKIYNFSIQPYVKKSEAIAK